MISVAEPKKQKKKKKKEFREDGAFRIWHAQQTLRVI